MSDLNTDALMPRVADLATTVQFEIPVHAVGGREAGMPDFRYYFSETFKPAVYEKCRQSAMVSAKTNGSQYE